ncbi:carcinoembryonic antigen-related cell adhesion molecule 5-like isoform X1 [Lemur catta]|uniref:carcinoembryonic antigen-related cell adhesion molecule 5-like isoform X1 n=1 Tax=Lemur catta TaxID=9447 RepID=UPI001E268B81|nr:carcinoembryonic antigen-related cell adhesion molecule 5-like isoform X1 [Lemur catta]
MEPPSAPPRRGRVPWQGLLLIVLLVTFWNPPATAQLTMESVPPNAVEGKDVLLVVHNLPQDALGYNWYRGDKVDSSYRIAGYVTVTQVNTTGPAYSGRETIYPNGSLLFQNVTLNDTGHYTLQLIKADLQNEEVTGQFRVYPELPKPSITSNNSSPVEDEDSIALTCEPETQDTTYLWWINGQRIQDSDRVVMSLNNRTIILLNITRNDTGPYECENWNPGSGNRSDPVTLDVLYGPDVPTISPPDSYYRLGTNLNLSCHAASNPPAQYSWLFNGSLQQSTQELFIPNLTVDNSGSYTCIAHNSATGRNRTTVKTITVFGELPKPSITSNNSSPVEDEDSVALTCEPETQDTTYLWWINGQRLQDSDRVVMSLNNRTIILLNITRNDTGPYECENWNPVSGNRSDPVTLDVLYGPDVPTISPPDSYYYPGTDLNLSCHAASNPPAQYSWLFNGSLQQSTQELFIPNLTVDNSGPYTCIAHNSATGRNRTTVKTITVFGELPKPSITSNNSSPVEDEDSVALTCEPETQDTTYLWWINGQRLQDSDRVVMSLNNRTIILLNITRNDTGPYECENWNPVSGNRSDPVTLDVLYGPDVPTISPPDSYYYPGTDLNLSCHAASNPPAQYSWLFNGSLQQSTQELFIPNLTVDNSGPYTCIAHNSATGRNRTTVKTITVFGELPKPSITSNNSSPVEDEDSVALTCEPETQDTTYLWWINGQRLQDSDRVVMSLNNRTIILLNITRNDTGPYECENWNPVSGNRSDPVTLDVLYGPDVPTISPPDSYYRLGTNLNLSCHAASNPPAQYSWLFNGSLQQSTQELFIPNLTVDNSGSYTCIAHNSATGRNRTTVKTITVFEPVAQPSIQGSSTTVTEDKDSVVLTCLTSDTGISIQWIFNNQNLQVTERMQLSQDNITLSINPVKRGDAGEYQCEVSNPISYHRSDIFRLTVEYGSSHGNSLSLSAGAIAGIVIGVLAWVALI